MRTILAALFVVVFLAAGYASANDSVGYLAAGGLVLSRNADIEMRAEDLYVSEKEIRVRYRFFNKSDKDIRTRVIFPMPDLPAPSGDGDDYELPVEVSANFLGFETKVNGRKVTAQVEQRVFIGKVDHTDVLKSLKVPLAPHLETTKTTIGALPPKQQTKLLELGLVHEEEYDVGQGMQKYLIPKWVLRSKYHWEQVFPAQKELMIEHRYQPSVGAMAGTIFHGDIGQDLLKEYKKKYCTERSFLAAVQRTQKKTDTPFQEHYLEYILTTGANWAGPIRNFRLVVDKGATDNLVSFCATNVKKISPTQFEVKAKNYTPRRNLKVLILKRGE
jgi:hypothetical protein